MAERESAQKTRDAPAIRFEAIVHTIDDRPIVRLPSDASAKLPSRGQVAVVGTLDRHAFETVVEPDGMRGHWLEVHDGLSPARPVRDGDTVTLEIEPSARWPEPEIPEDLSAALADATDLSGVWADITPMARWEWVRWIKATRNPDTRNRRVEVSISKLRAGKRRPCCFDLSSCTDPDLSRSGKLVDPR